MHQLSELNRYFRQYRWSILLGTLYLTISNFFLIWIPVLIRRTMDEVELLGEQTDQEWTHLGELLFMSDAGAILAYNSILLVGTVILYGTLLFATRQTLIVSSRKIEYDIRNDLLEKLLILPQRYFSENRSGEIYIRATEDIARVREYFGPVYMYTINTITRAGFIIVMMLIVNRELTFWALLPLPFLSAFAYWVSGFIHRYQTLIQEQYSNIAGRANEAFTSIRLIKAYNREAYEQEKFDQESRSYRQKKLKLDLVESLFHPTLNLLIGLSVIIVVWKGGVMVIDNQITVGNIAEFVIYVAYLTWPVASLGYTVNRFQKSIASWDRISVLMKEPVDIQSNDETDHSLEECRGEIEFDHVSFTYPGSDEKVLQDVTFKIEAGEHVAIVGRTGSGKSTLVQLIPRLFDPGEGTIRLDGVDVRDWPVALLRRRIGYVPQDTFLFSTTLRENIGFGLDKVTDDQIYEAAEKAQIRENILEFERKFMTMVGERGITLSGGQKQRTAIARALIKKPSILILDDSLSAVDTKTEDAILKYLQQEFQGRTTLMISHRISSIKNADTIFYIEKGRLIERGTHDELLDLDGRYADMYRKQLLEKELAELQ
ncbi:MAG: ABC transporter ATP-binding protein [Balneolaceae bacterium]